MAQPDPTRQELPKGEPQVTTLVFLDTETTGIDPVQNQILTIGLVIDHNGTITKQREIKVRYEGGAYTQEALRVNGVDLETWNDQIDIYTPLEALQELYRELRGLGYKTYVAHNAEFDKNMIAATTIRAGASDEAFLARSHWLCTLQLSKWLINDGLLETKSGSVKLDRVLEALGHQARGSDVHGALNDAFLARDLYYELRSIAGWVSR